MEVTQSSAQGLERAQWEGAAGHVGRNKTGASPLLQEQACRSRSKPVIAGGSLLCPSRPHPGLYTKTHMHTHAHTCTDAHTNASTHMCTHAHLHMHAHTSRLMTCSRRRDVLGQGCYRQSSNQQTPHAGQTPGSATSQASSLCCWQHS